MSIDFDEIPYDWLEPANLAEIKANYRKVGTLPWPEKVLIVGHKLAAGSIAPGQVVEITRAAEGAAWCGRGSIGAEQVSAFKAANRTTPVYLAALADAVDAVKATGTLTFTGAVGGATVLRFLVGGRQVRITALTTDAVAALATKLAAAINADVDNVTTAVAAAGVVTVTARSAGEIGNEIDIRVDTGAQPLPAGLGVAIAPMSGGSGNPLLQTVLDAISNGWYTKIIVPWSDATNMAALAEWLRLRYLATSRLDAHAFVARRGTYGELGTFGGLTNSPHITALGLNRSPSSSWVISASAGGVAAFHLTNDPARQLQSLTLPGVRAPDDVDQFEDEEKNLLLRTGISTLNGLTDGTVTISRLITTYKKSSLGIDDRAWLDIMVPVTMSRIRYDWAAYVSLLYPRAKLVDDESDAASASRHDDDDDPGTAVVTPRRMHASWAARCKLYAEKVWIEDATRTIKESLFQRSQDDRDRLESRQQVRIVGNLMVLAASLEFQV